MQSLRKDFNLAGSQSHDRQDAWSANEQEILRCVQFALRSAVPERLQCERRRERRYPFPYPVRLQPVDAARQAIASPLVVIGKHITNHGLDFYCQQSIPYRRVIARFEPDPGQHVELLMTLTWCRFAYHGWYENGGRFLSAVLRDERQLPAAEPPVFAEIAAEAPTLVLGQ